MSETKDRLLRGQEAISRPGLFRHRPQATRSRSPGCLELDVSFFSGRKRTARRRGDPLWRRTLCTNDQAMLCPDPREATAAMFSGEAKILRSSGFRLGCPVASVALNVASTTETVRKAVRRRFCHLDQCAGRGHRRVRNAAGNGDRPRKLHPGLARRRDHPEPHLQEREAPGANGAVRPAHDPRNDPRNH
jgi:hypothetical protein